MCRWLRWWSAGSAVGLLTGCAEAGAPSIMAPRGPAAAEIAQLWWLLLGMGSAVYLVVMALLVLSLIRRGREDAPLSERERRGGNRMIVAGLLLALVILLVVFGFTLTTQIAISVPDESGEITIRVIGRQWWWEVHYPNEQIVTANEIHIPVGQPVRVELMAGDVIHSFWAPELHGKLDMVPGQTNVTWLKADEPGEYWGLCAEFCGIQHAKMRFLVVAEPPEAYAAWVAQQQQPAAPPSSDLAARGQAIFMGGSCVHCHAIAGTEAAGRLGPDLTHVASRRTLGAGALPFNRGNLAGWVVDPQHIKPGNLMPAAALTGEELQALLAYLEGLQ
ncbi:MAG TPA: cytochrome c oxidase subunit II [Caldilineaceae bacterium]|nr:cytochrome c oxidase subunit II [Caldilineaceae bacterium]